MSSITVSRDLRGRFGSARDQEARQTCLAFAMSDAHAAAIGGMWSPLSCEYLFYHAKQLGRLLGAVGVCLAERAIYEPPSQGRADHQIGDTMFRGIEEKSCARAWAAACESIIGTHDEGYNVVIDVADPVKHDAKDNE